MSEKKRNNTMEDSEINNKKNITSEADIKKFIENDNNTQYNIKLNFDVIRRVHQVSTNTTVNNVEIDTTSANLNTNADTTEPKTGSYASYIVGISLTLGLLFIILSTAIIISYIQRRNYKRFLEKKEKERRIKLGQSVQSLKSTNDVLNLLSDTTKSEINTYPLCDDKNIPLFQICIYPNYSYKDLEKKYQPKSEKDISTLFEEYNSPQKSSTHHSITNNSNVASLFKNSRLYSQTLPSMNDATEMDISNGMGQTNGSSNGFPSSSTTLHHSQYYSRTDSRTNSRTESPSYSQIQSGSTTESMSESYDGTTTTTTEDPDKSFSLSQSIFTALQQKHSLRESYKKKIGLDLMNIPYNKSDSFSQDPSDMSRFSTMEDSEPLPYYSLDMSESDYYNTEVSDSMDGIGDLTMQTTNSRYTKADDVNTSFSPSFIIASEKVMNENTDSILKDINNQNYFDNQNKKQSFPTVSSLNTTSSNGINFSKKPSPYTSISNFNDRLKTKPSNESLSTTISSISNVRSLYNLAPSVYDNYSTEEESTEMDEESKAEDNVRTNNSFPKNSMERLKPGDPMSSFQSTPSQRIPTINSQQAPSSPQQLKSPQPLKSPKPIKSPHSNNNTNVNDSYNKNSTDYIPHSPGNKRVSSSPKPKPNSPRISEKHSPYHHNSSTGNNNYPPVTPKRNETKSQSASTHNPGHGYLSPSKTPDNNNKLTNHPVNVNSSKGEESNKNGLNPNLSTSEIKRTSYNEMLLEIHNIEKDNDINNGLTEESTEVDVDSSFQDNSYYNNNNNLSHSMSLFNSPQEKSQNLHTLSLRVPDKNNHHSNSNPQYYNSISNSTPNSNSNPNANHSSNYLTPNYYPNQNERTSSNPNKSHLSHQSHQNSYQQQPYQPQHSYHQQQNPNNPSSPSIHSNNYNKSFTQSDSLIPSPVSDIDNANSNNEHYQENDDSNESFSNSTSYSTSQSISKSDVFLLNSPTMKTAIKKKIRSRKKIDRVGNRYHYPALCQKTFKAQCTYMPKNNKKVPINFGDIIKIFQIYDDGWAYGRVESVSNHSFREGLFPVIEMLEQGGLKEIYPPEATSLPYRNSTGSNGSNGNNATGEESPNPNPGVNPTPNQNPTVTPTLSSPSVHSSIYRSKSPSVKTTSSTNTHHANTINGTYHMSHGKHSNDRTEPSVITSNAYPPHYKGPVKQNTYVAQHHSHSMNHSHGPTMAYQPSPKLKPINAEEDRDEMNSQSSRHSLQSIQSNSNRTNHSSSGNFVKQSSYYIKQPYSPLQQPQSTVPVSPAFSAHYSQQQQQQQQQQQLPPMSPNLSPQRQYQLNKMNSDIRDIRAMLRRGGIDTGTRKALQERLDQLELDKKRNYSPMLIHKK